MRIPVVLTLVALTATGCTSGTLLPGPGPSSDTGAVRQAAAQLAAALAKKDLSPVTFSAGDGATVNSTFQPLVRGMGSLSPTVDVIDVKASGTSGSASLSYTWAFPGVSQPWTYQTSVQLVEQDGQWRPTWTPAVLAPGLDGSHRLSQRRVYPVRGEILGQDGEALVATRPVVRIGLDKSRVAAADQAGSARRLAKLVGIASKDYVALVQGAGSAQFVEAITFRRQDPDRPSSAELKAIPGALAVEGEAMLPPTRTFARALLGRVGQATAEIVSQSNGTVVAGDEVGLDGLESRYDDQLRGSPGVLVQVVPTTGGGDGSAGSPSPSPSATDSPSPSASPDASGTTTAYEVKAVDGRPLKTSLSLDLQELAEKTLATNKGAASLVAIRPSTGAVLVAANNDATNGQPVATFGQVQPGSTFKVVSALALLRAGLTPDSPVSCPRTITVGGRTYENYDDYPSNHLGRIDLATAFAQSCNTAFIGLRDKLKADALQAAAASLGLGADYDVGFPAYFGSVPVGGNANARAEAMFGQGKDQASPLAMALVAASVEAGHTVLPVLVDDQDASSTADPLSSAEAASLKQLMRGVVTQGSGRRLAGLGGSQVIAKTGTAEYGSDNPPKTHAWMIAAQGDLAVAVFVQDGTSGSGTAGPLLEAFLRGAS